MRSEELIAELEKEQQKLVFDLYKLQEVLDVARELHKLRHDPRITTYRFGGDLWNDVDLAKLEKAGYKVEDNWIGFFSEQLVYDVTWEAE